MDYRKLIVESWVYTQKNKRLIVWLGFIPAIFTTTVGAGYIAYQFFAFQRSYIFSGGDEESFLHVVATFIWEFIRTHVSWTVPLIVFGVIFYLCNLFIPTIAKAGAIQMIARNRNGQETGVSGGIRYGIMSFLPLFEYHLLIKTFSIFAILIEISFVLRNLGPVIFKFLMPVFIIFSFLSFLLTLLFIYTDFFIVVDGEKVFDSMRKSAKLVIMNWKHTFLIAVLMILIGVRIVIQALLVFLIPALIIVISGYLATVTLPVTGLIIGGIFGFVALILASYLNGIVDIFSYAVWTYTFLDVSSEQEISARENVSAREIFKDTLAETPEAHDHSYSGHKNL